MAQWIRIHLPMQGTPCWFLVQEDSTCHRATKAVSHKHWAHSRNYRACVPQLLTPACPEKAMATHSSVLAWRIPGSAEPGGLLSMGSHRVGHDWRDLAAAAAAWSPYSVTISAEFQRPLEALAQLFAVLLFMACFSTAHCILLALIFLNLSLCDCLWTWWQLWLW